MNLAEARHQSVAATLTAIAGSAVVTASAHEHEVTTGRYPTLVLEHSSRFAEAAETSTTAFPPWYFPTKEDVVLYDDYDPHRRGHHRQPPRHWPTPSAPPPPQSRRPARPTRTATWPG